MGRATLSVWIGGGVFLGFEMWGSFWMGLSFFGGEMVGVWCCVGLYGAFSHLRLGIWYRGDFRVGQEGIDWLALLYGN